MADDRLPATVVDPPNNVRVPPPRPEPVAIRFGRQVIAEHEPGGWVRLDRKVGRSIVSEKAKVWAARHGVEFKTSVDNVDRNDPTSERYTHLFCRALVVDDVLLVDAEQQARVVAP